MKNVMLLCGILPLIGCTSIQLKQSTLAQGATVSDLQYTMVLDNIAMQRQMPGALPWHIKLTQGNVTMNDAINPSANYTGGASVARMFSGSGQLGWQETWTVVPELDKRHLENLLKIYKRYYLTNWIEDGFGPIGYASGHYGRKGVWVKPANMKDLTALTQEVLVAGKVIDSERSIMLPGPVHNSSLP